uniref:peptidylprolyl isomerase n=1 Tax=Opuntia streptacantha TaxID=393608 RepID=A0A7C9A8P3_OPUST
MAFWGVEVKPGKPFTHSPDKAGGRLRISQATLGTGSSNNKSLVQCNVGKKSPVLLCSLLPGVLESCHLELEFDEVEEVIFSVIGARSVHLSGYYLGNVRQLGGIDESESYGEDIGDTDTERSDDRNFEDEYEDSFIDDGGLEVASPSPSSDEVASKKKTKKKKADSPRRTCRRLKKKYELRESEDDYVPSEHDAASDEIRGQIVQSDDDDQLPIASILGNPSVAKDSNRQICTSNDSQSEETKAKGTKRKNNKENEAQATDNTDEDQSEEEAFKKKKRKSTKENEAAPVSTADENRCEEKKAKKKRKGSKENEAFIRTESPRVLGDSETDHSMKRRETETDHITRTLSGGLVIEELDIGKPDGKVATSGTKVTIHYTGKLKEGGRVFDSTVGKDPLKFRLGKGHALDGLDIGIEGMQVGGKRRLIIPPPLGFGNEGSERVPPKSWLIMEVELLKVR